MNMPEFFTIIGSAIAIIGFMYGIIRNLKIDIDSRIEKLDSKMDGWIKHSIAMQSEQSKRIDQTNGRIDDMYQVIMRMLETKK